MCRLRPVGGGDHAGRPTVRTPHPTLALAGDGIRIDLPVALMEQYIPVRLTMRLNLQPQRSSPTLTETSYRL